MVIIGSGAGGGTMAHALAGSGARILILERGDFVPQEAENWDPAAVWKDLGISPLSAGSTTAAENSVRTRTTTSAEIPSSGAACSIGCGVRTSGRWSIATACRPPGRSTTTPSRRTTIAPNAYKVRGQHGIDPTEPARGPYPCQAVDHAGDGGHRRATARAGAASLAAPLGLLRPGEPDGCILCNTCNSFVCRIHAKSEADICAVRPAVAQPNVTLWTNACARRLITDTRGRKVQAVEVERNGEIVRSRHRSSSCRAVRSTSRRCCCDRRATRIRTAWPIHRAGRTPLHGAPRDHDAGVSSLPAQLDTLPEDGGDQRFLSSWAALAVSARADSVAGPDPRCDGADRLSTSSSEPTNGGSRAAWTGW